jgi:hypothetical protein
MSLLSLNTLSHFINAIPLSLQALLLIPSYSIQGREGEFSVNSVVSMPANFRHITARGEAQGFGALGLTASRREFVQVRSLRVYVSCEEAAKV